MPITMKIFQQWTGKKWKIGTRRTLELLM